MLTGRRAEVSTSRGGGGFDPPVIQAEGRAFTREGISIFRFRSYGALGARLGVREPVCGESAGSKYSMREQRPGAYFSFSATAL